MPQESVSKRRTTLPLRLNLKSSKISQFTNEAMDDARIRSPGQHGFWVLQEAPKGVDPAVDQPPMLG